MKKFKIVAMSWKPYVWLVRWLPRITTALSILLLVVSAFIYPTLPNMFPNHVNILGQADSFGVKSSIFLFPITLFVLGLAVKTIDRKYNSFYFNSVMILLTISVVVVVIKMYSSYV